ncbi:MAG: SCO family protein [Bacteroidota bacterium]|nr:SCO family protein [Bacteroidota bacterium]
MINRSFKIGILLCLIALLTSCDPKHDSAPQSSDLTVNEHSIFNLESTWFTQDSQAIHLKDLKGKVTVMVMIYTSCKVACPRLVADMRNIADDVPEKYLSNINFVLVSIDPETDTPARLKNFASTNEMDASYWIFLQGTESTTRELANVLSVKYEEISPLDFSHSNIISVFNPQGVLVHQQEGLGLDNEKTIARITETLKAL